MYLYYSTIKVLGLEAFIDEENLETVDYYEEIRS